jgi:hypothetical protein
MQGSGQPDKSISGKEVMRSGMDGGKNSARS